MGRARPVWRTLLLAVLALAQARAGRATVFYPGEPSNTWNSWAACLRRPLRDTDAGVAHPTLPCGSRVLLLNLRTGRSTVAPVIDRGPAHALVDCTRPVALALGGHPIAVARGSWDAQVLLVPIP